MQASSGSIMTDASTQTEQIQLLDAEIQKSWETTFAKKHGKRRSTCTYCSWHGKAWRRAADTGEEIPTAAAIAASGGYQRECTTSGFWLPIATDTAASGGLQGEGNSIAADTEVYRRYEREWETMEADNASCTRGQRSEDTVPTDYAVYEREWDPMAQHTVGSGRDARREQVRLTLELSMLATKEIRLEREIQQLRNERDMWMRRVLVLTTCSEKKREREMERERECRRLMEDRLRMTEERFHRFQDEVVKYLRMECKSGAF